MFFAQCDDYISIIGEKSRNFSDLEKERTIGPNKKSKNFFILLDKLQSSFHSTIIVISPLIWLDFQICIKNSTCHWRRFEKSHCGAVWLELDDDLQQRSGRFWVSTTLAMDIGSSLSCWTILIREHSSCGQKPVIMDHRTVRFKPKKGLERTTVVKHIRRQQGFIKKTRQFHFIIQKCSLWLKWLSSHLN